MIPLHKLNTLPHSQRLRKAASLVRNAELKFVLSGLFSESDAQYFYDLAGLLAEDKEFPNAALEALKAAQGIFLSSVSKGGTGEIRRALNSIHHILLAKTGRIQADWDFFSEAGVLDSSKRKTFSGMLVYLEDIRSPFNVGSIFRAADSFGIEKIWLSPLCADPRHKRAERTAMGCVDIIPWERFQKEPFSEATQAFTENGKQACPPEFSSGPFFALETGGTPLPDFSFPKQGILIVGSEELGVSPPALAAADASLGRVTIQTMGAKGSLNVAVAFGIVVQAWAERLKDANLPGKLEC